MTYRFRFKPYRLRLQMPLRSVHGLWTEREGILVRLEDEGSSVRFGEIAPIPWFGTETLREAEEICSSFGDRVSDEILDAVPERYGCVRFALAQAREHGGAAPLSSARLAVAALLPSGRDAIDRLPRLLEAGFLTFKWKVGVRDIIEETGILDDLCALLPSHAKLRLDANGAWERRHAARWLDRCVGRPVEFVEQPVPPADEDALLGLARDYPVALALDESVVRISEARRWQQIGWPGIFVIKPAIAGPPREVSEWARESKADIVISSAIESALARNRVLQLALGGGITKRALGFGTGPLFEKPEWNGPQLGPIADQTCFIPDAGEKLWSSI